MLFIRQNIALPATAQNFAIEEERELVG